MKHRLRPASIAWLAISAAMFIAAVLLTMTITWTEGGLIERGANDNAGHIEQVMSIYEAGATEESSETYFVNYAENEAGDEGVVTFFIPINAAPVLLISGLKDDNDCTSPRTADQVSQDDAEGGGVNVTIEKIKSELLEQALYVVTPVPSPYGEEEVQCRVRPISRSDTFTSRTLAILHYAPWLSQAFAGIGKERVEIDKPLSERLAGLEPLPLLTVNFSNIPGSKNTHFLGGFEALDGDYARETKRVIVPGEYAWVMWDDVYRQQFRDIFLIVIGTLIGIGVTVMIEGLRPLIEGLGERSPSAPTDRKNESPPAPTSQNSP